MGNFSVIENQVLGIQFGARSLRFNWDEEEAKTSQFTRQNNFRGFRLVIKIANCLPRVSGKHKTKVRAI